MLNTRNEQIIAQKGENGYHSFRIPGILPAENGALLLCCEARAENAGDWGDIDVVVWRMEADGSRRQTLKIGSSHLSPDGTMRTYNNPVLIPDGGERVHLIYHRNYERAFVVTSADGGRTWGESREITAAYRESPFAWNVCATGPGHGIRMRDGRLVASIWLANGAQEGLVRKHWPSAAGCIVSDDHGQTWHAGALAQDACIVNGNETTVAQLPDGRLLFNFRNMNPSRRRVLALSENGEQLGKIWVCDALPDPMCFAGQAAGEKGVLFGNCVSEEKRVDAAVKYSKDAGETWEKIWNVDQQAGYIDIAYANGRVYAFYERYSYENRIVESLVLKESECMAL